MSSSNANSTSAEDTRSAGAESVLACALLVARGVRDPYLRGDALCDVAEGYIKLGDTKRATKVLSEALRTAGDMKDHEEKAQLLLDISIKCAEAGDLEKALRAAKRISEPGCLFHALRRIAAAWIQAGDCERAIAVVESIKPPSENAVALSVLVAASAVTGQKERTRELLAKLFFSFEQGRGASDMRKALADVAHNLAKAGLFRQALRAVRRIRGAYWKGYATIRIADAYAGARKRKKCLAKLSEVVEIASSVPEAFLRVELFTLVAGIYLDLKERGAAIQLLEKCFASAKRIRDPIDKSLALGTIAFGYVGAGDYEQALKVANATDDRYGRAVQLAFVAGGLAEAGIFDKALQVAGRIRDPEALDMAFALIVSGLARRGHFDQALWMAQSIKDPRGKAASFSGLADVHLESGRYTEALQMAAKIELRHILSQTLVNIAAEYAKSRHTPGRDETGILDEIAKRRF